MHEIRALVLGNRRVETGAPHASGVIQLAILSDSEFNAYELDLATVRVGEASVATGGNGDYLASYMDRDHDGLKDLLIQVRTNDVGSATEDLPLRVEGRTKEGRLVRAYVQSRSAPALSPQHAEDPVVSAQPLVFDVQFRGPFSTGSGLSMLVSVPAPGDLQIALYDARGRRVHEQEFDRLPSGAHSLTLQMPPTANSGIYFCRARFNEQVVSRKVVLLTR